MLNMYSLKTLYIGLATIYANWIVYPLEIKLLHCLTHLHLSATRVVAYSIPLGFTHLKHLTHLSVHWSALCTSTTSLQLFLGKSSATLIVL